MNKLTAIGTALTSIVLVTACVGSPATPVATAPAGDNRPTASLPVESPMSAPTPSSHSVQRLGSAYTWQDGLSVTIGTPASYKPSEYAAGKEGFARFVALDVIVVNKTPNVWDPVGFRASVQSANEEGSRIFDSAKLPDTPSTKLLPGREAKFKMAFGVADPADLVVEVAPDYDHQSVIFQR